MNIFNATLEKSAIMLDYVVSNHIHNSEATY